ncbi:MAG: alkyl sulfatase C-terminal domain-containing protein, partial [Actinomycetota bacterium]
LRVLLDPSRAEGVEVHVRFDIDGEATGLQLRNCVAVPSNGAGATVEVAMSRSTLTAILAAKLMWSKADIVVHGDEAQVEVFRRCFDHAGMQG